jgi:hypothetical protein
MAETKTKQTKASVRDFVAAVENDTRRADAKALLKLLRLHGMASQTIAGTTGNSKSW